VGLDVDDIETVIADFTQQDVTFEHYVRGAAVEQPEVTSR
jgi:hypothetical protein